MASTDEIIQKVWEKGLTVSGNDPKIWRKDQCRAWIRRRFYGNRKSQYGWEIDHIKPKDDGGTDDLFNLRPLQWMNNAEKQEGRLTCPVTSSGVDNIRK
jgi:hypothetical protein